LSRCGAACAIAGAKNARIKKKLQQCDEVRGCFKTFSFNAGKVRIGYPSPAAEKVPAQMRRTSQNTFLAWSSSQPVLASNHNTAMLPPCSRAYKAGN
jgi:hypothetical protein